MVIHPLVGVDDLELGISRQRARELLGSGFDSFRKDVGENLTDAYDDLGLHLYFDDNDRLEFIEIFEPATVSVESIELLDREVVEVETDLQSLGSTARMTDIGLRFDELGLALTASDGIVEGVGVYGQSDCERQGRKKERERKQKRG